MEFKTIDVKDLLDEREFQLIQEELNALHRQLVQLKWNLFIIEQIESFPFHLFLPPPNSNFWQFIKNSLLETSIMIIWRIILDEDTRTVTFCSFRKNILKKIRADRQNQKRQIEELFETTGFNRELTSVGERIRAIRNNYYGHHNRGWYTNAPDTEIKTFSLDDLKCLLAVSKNLFDCLCFDKISRPLDDWGLEEIERRLDQVAFECDLITCSKERFNLMYNDLSSEDIKIVNNYRRKFNQSEI